MLFIFESYPRVAWESTYQFNLMEKKNLKIWCTDHAEILALSKARGISIAVLFHEIFQQYQERRTKEISDAVQPDISPLKDVIQDQLENWAKTSLAPLPLIEQKLEDVLSQLNAHRLSGLIQHARLLDAPMCCPGCSVAIDRDTFQMQSHALSCLSCGYQLHLEPTAHLESFDLLVLLYGGITRVLPGTHTRYFLDPQTQFQLVAL